MVNIIELVEEICDFPLTDFQKEFVVKAYDAAKNKNCLYYIPPRGSSKFSFDILQAIVIMIVAQESGLLNKKLDICNFPLTDCHKEFVMKARTDDYSIEKHLREPMKYDPYKYAREFEEHDD